MSVEMPTNELVDFRLCGGMEVLELVHRLELDDVQTIGKHAVGLAFE